jgi:hypothetical protein
MLDSNGVSDSIIKEVGEGYFVLQGQNFTNMCDVINELIFFDISDVLAPNVVVVERKFIIKILFEKPAKKFITYDVSLAQFVANSCPLVKSCTCSRVMMASYAEITTSNKVSI